jgi:lipopolysaccharide transport system permease protein
LNPHLNPPTSPLSLLDGLWSNRKLIRRMVRREVIGRYHGSLLGLGWSFLNPLFMLALYTFIFSVVFKARWGVDGEESKIVFAIVLYVGLICHGMLSEVMLQAPGLIHANVNYVKKVVFPLEILVVVAMGSAIFHTLVSLSVLLLMFFLEYGFLHWTVILAPLVLLPLVLVTLGLSWILASAGVYIRDVKQTVGILSTVLLFFSPVFFPLSMMPERLHLLMMLNPLTFIIEQARKVLILGQTPDWHGLAIYSAAACLGMWVGYWWFQKTRKGFADVL